MTSVGFSHSGIAGSTVVCTSPTLIAAYHALHRLLEPRHPPRALTNLSEIPSTRNGHGSINALVKLLFYFIVEQHPVVVPRYFAYDLIIRLSKTKIPENTSKAPAGTLVELTGLEPVTSGLQSRRSPN